MPTAKDKGGSTSHRYRPASEYDDATLTQKREYWRTKKREQRARLTERRGKSTQDGRGEKLHLHAPALVNSSLSGSFAAFSSPLESNDESYKSANISPASQSRNTKQVSSVEATNSQKEKWIHTAKLNKVLPQMPAPCSISAKAARGDRATVKSLTARGAVSRAVTSLTPSGTQLNIRSSVPPVRVTPATNGSSAKRTPQPCVSMQGASGPKMQHKAQVPLRIQPKLLPSNVSTGMILVSSPCVPVSIKTEGKTETPQRGTKSALVTLQRAKGVSNLQNSPEPEDERAAKRREQWRIKKREQRAKLAAQVAKVRERTQSAELALQRQTAQKAGVVGGTVLQHLPSQSFLRGASQKKRVKPSFASVKRENDKLQSGAANLATINFQADQIKVQNPHENRQTAITCGVISVRKPVESQRRLPSSVHLSNVSRGIALSRCKTPRQRFIEAQKIFMNQRNMRCKSPLLSSLFSSRNIPPIDPNDTPEQIIAKRREYWRIKKREQRAKLTMEMKARLKEKDSLMRRVKRYQKILEEMRRARALAQSGGSTLTHASETIGGFIKEDGTVTINIPQVPTGHNQAAPKSEDKSCVVSNNTSITKPQHQPNTKRRGITPIRVTQSPPPLRPAQVKVSFPLAGQSVNKPPRLLAIRPRTQLESTTAPNSHKSAIQTVSQLTLTHPQTPQNAIAGGSTTGSNLGGCVMKMAVSSCAPSLSALSLDPDLTEEERMAKKREYWRIKKREQRAARAARLKQGVLQARANATLQRRKAQKQVAATTVPLGKNHAGNAQSLPDNSAPVSPHADEIKQEGESVPAADLNSQPEQAICLDIKPPTSPTPPPAPQPEPDPALNADCQATTLLAVASMKKLLEESLSSVTECKSQQTDIKTESTLESTEQDLKLELPDVNDVSPIDADLMLEINRWQADADTLAEADSPSLHLKDSPQRSETPSPPPTSNQVAPHPTCEHSSQTHSNFIINPSMEASYGPSSPPRTQRLRPKTADHQTCPTLEPPKLHHLPIDQLQPRLCEPQCQAQNSNSTSPQGYPSAVTEHSGLMSLQSKREYWKLMKRQQRARLRARQRERQGECSSRLSHRNIQAPGLVIINNAKGVNRQAKPTLRPKPPTTSLTSVRRIPTVLVVNPTTCNAEQSPGTLQVKLPVTSVPCSPTSEQNNMDVGPSQILSDYEETHENQQQAMPDSQEWICRSTDVDSVPSLPTLTPPDNPLSSINLQPIEPPCQTANSTLSPIKMPCAQVQSPTPVVQSPTKLVPTCTLVPPKPIPGESEEDFLRRKREYWRIKKKEQRARKAIRDKGVSPRRASNNLRPILPAQDLPTQDSGQWVSSSEEPQHLMSTSEDTDPGSFPFSTFAAPTEEESGLPFADFENANEEEGPISDAMWRNRYLMDYDPLNQLLVCMVCGELQYSQTVEGVRAHIDEAHPDTLALEPGEQQQILENWDEQVSQRERFFTSQLQQHSGALPETQRD
ncbi:uncharacterized protein si:dkey-28a3.2 [Plectropomus leopardus]|uniref:uncharacterized protein si:dkey-28a3.2 n=1 Tax=Plectropomus leopardus TaxID=160734 RepID=UPI001C4D5F11|nr:uncharacterized protein si:dkey-28a3.2 [Plectropomus leopardus]XP_042367914.1 uncharacterized protein si:dkey-28a3.2 [Plectropomus leopardus]XP_042367915.1 uncharacterized protein si:dkey-28a3.2 [Plectropomus leopardus]XP_042367916.1 uncharacterized protein si:dkey-28a3.2 [Plectropomus leopardus]